MYESVSKSLQELESNCSGRGEERVGCVVYDYISLVFCRDKTKIYVRQGRNACSEWYGEGTEQNLEVEIKSAGIMWIMCWVKKQMWGENIKGSVWTLVIIRNYYTTVQSCPPAALSSLLQSWGFLNGRRKTWKFCDECYWDCPRAIISWLILLVS